MSGKGTQICGANQIKIELTGPKVGVNVGDSVGVSVCKAKRRSDIR